MSFDGWNNLLLGQIVKISSSKRIYAKEYTESGMPFYRSKEIIEKSRGKSITNKLFISLDRYESIKNKYGVPAQGEILLTSVGTLGVPYMVKDEEFYFKDGNLTWIKNYEKNINNVFIYYWLLSKEAKIQIDTKSIGSTQKALTIETLNKFNILLPPYKTQKDIANILSSLDEKIEVNNQINETLENMAQALFKQWFVDFEFPNENGEPYKSSGGEMSDSEKGFIPEGWKVVQLDQISNITMGQSPKGTSYNENGEGVVFYQGRTDFNKRYPKRRLFTTEPKRIAAKGDILMSVRAPVGDINIAIEECCIGRGLAALNSKTGANSFLLYTMLKLRDEFEIYNGEGTVFGSINQKNLKSIKVIKPHNEVISLFENVVSSMDREYYSLVTESRRLEELRDTLLPKLMSGEIRVPLDELEESMTQ